MKHSWELPAAAQWHSNLCAGQQIANHPLEEKESRSQSPEWIVTFGKYQGINNLPTLLVYSSDNLHAALRQVAPRISVSNARTLTNLNLFIKHTQNKHVSSQLSSQNQHLSNWTQCHLPLLLILVDGNTTPLALQARPLTLAEHIFKFSFLTIMNEPSKSANNVLNIQNQFTPL